MPTPPRAHALLLLVLAAGFAIAYTQSPLFYSNQNQYLLHGLAAAGYGQLNQDWLANTTDPTPLFSFGVALAYRVVGLWALQVAFFVLLMAYFVAAWWLAATVLPSPLEGEGGSRSEPGEGKQAPSLPSPARPSAACPLPQGERGMTRLLGFAALFTAAHAALPRWLSVQLVGVDYPWFLQSGLAGQYALGPGLQPSAFAVLLIAGLAAWANGRSYLGAILGASACLVHPTYLLPAGLLTLGYIHTLARERRPRAAIAVGAVSLAIVLPVIVYTLVHFAGDAPKAAGAAEHILTTIRIPHHAVISRWFDAIAALQIAWIVLGIVLARRTRLFVPLVVATIGAAVLTLLQLVTGNETLALLFPWRLSALLVPVATAIVAIHLVERLPDRRWLGWASGVVFFALVVGGVVVMVCGLGYRMNEDERPTLDYVRDHVRPDEVYLIPTKFPEVGKGRGSMSATFTPPPRPKPGSNLIPVDLQRFRLATGAPIFVDFKSVPYTDLEVLEWFRRMRQVEEWYATADWDAAGIREQLRAERITHVLIPRQQSIHASFLEPLYTDEVYGVYRVK